MHRDNWARDRTPFCFNLAAFLLQSSHLFPVHYSTKIDKSSLSFRRKLLDQVDVDVLFFRDDTP